MVGSRYRSIFLTSLFSSSAVHEVAFWDVCSSSMADGLSWFGSLREDMMCYVNTKCFYSWWQRTLVIEFDFPRSKVLRLYIGSKSGVTTNHPFLGETTLGQIHLSFHPQVQINVKHSRYEGLSRECAMYERPFSHGLSHQGSII